MTRTADGSPPIVCTPRRIASASPIDDRHAFAAEIGVAQQCLRGDLRSDAGDVAEREREHGLGHSRLHPFDAADERILGAESTGLRKHRHAISLSADDDAERNSFEQAVDDANARRAEPR